jgi:hypothetical protein
VRQQFAAKLAEARTDGTQLLETCAKLAAGTLSPQDRLAFLDQLIAANGSALERDQKDEVEDRKAAVEIMAQKSGLPLNMPVPGMGSTMGPLVHAALAETFGRVFDVGRAIGNPRKDVLASLLFNRGLFPFTPNALDLWKRPPQPGQIPETIEQALFQPVAKTLEGFYAARFNARLDSTILSYLASNRRVGSPRFQALPPHS